VPVDVPDAVRGIGPAANGAYGYGISGFGYGGGGTGWGTIGLGHYGTIGHGSGTGVGYGAGGGHGGMMAHTASAPTIVIGQPIAVGDLDKDIIRRYVKRSLEKLRYCYEKRLLAKPGLSGTVTAHFTISPTGSVLESTADGLDDDVGSCIADVVKQIEFPKTERGGAVKVNYPLTFQSNVVKEENAP